MQVEEEGTLRRWLPIAVFVIALHVIAIGLVYRSKTQSQAQLPVEGAPGIPGMAGGAGPAVEPNAIVCDYTLRGVEMHLRTIDRKGQGDWATCPDLIAVQDLIVAPGAQTTAPVIVVVDVGYTSVLKASRIAQDGGNARFASLVQRRVNSIPHRTPSTLTPSSAPITYSYQLDFNPR